MSGGRVASLRRLAVIRWLIVALMLAVAVGLAVDVSLTSAVTYLIGAWGAGQLGYGYAQEQRLRGGRR